MGRNPISKPDTDRRHMISCIIIAYPLLLAITALFLNYFLFGVFPLAISIPTEPVLRSVIAAGLLLLINHSWLMTSTELTRLRYRISPTAEEWNVSGNSKEKVSDEGWQELERRHQAHRNLTENAVYFGILAAMMSVVSPMVMAAQVWIIGFALSRLGYTYSYLKKWTGARGVFMSLSLLCLYGMAGYLVLALVV